jgi:protein-S-isoprenylcysteine O-methyltransferase Ste14
MYTACESAVVLANQFPSETSNKVLSWLVRPGYPASAIRVTFPWLVGCACLCIGPTIRYYAVREMGRLLTWELSIKKDHKLVTTGPYAIIRHPSYFGNLFMLAGTFLCHIGPGSWYREAGWLSTVGGKVVAGLWFACGSWVQVLMILRLQREDDVLRKHFPEEWEAWAKQTPYKIIPYVY